MFRGLLLILLLAAAGCGSDNQPHEPGRAAVDCREKWKDLGSEIGGQDTRTSPSALPQRWDNIAATVSYYARSASGKDCGKTIEGPRAAMGALTAFSAKLAPYDMELRLQEVRPDAPGTPDVAAALNTLATQAPLATQQQGPGWAQADVTELSDTAAVAKAVKDLGFLSSESPAYQACSAALTRIQAAIRTR